MGWPDHTVVVCLIPLAIWILVSGLDDLFIDLVYLLPRRRRLDWPSDRSLESAPERRIAIFVPLWNEHRVIGQMLGHNLSVIRYANFDVFVGVYPNDLATARAVGEVAARHPRVHLAMCPHDGPTSKGDCLNWIYRWMEAHEQRTGLHFDVIVTHDAEDLIHPDALRLINWFSPAYDMVQVPVLPLPTGIAEVTHGLYCDEFAEYQSKDIPVRQRLGGFLPSNGVGTGFGRIALERLAARRKGRIFDPECLTEDYENGFLLHALGRTQIFLPLRFTESDLQATREYFPRNLRGAIRQRTRWVTGIVLQGWERHGWRVNWRQLYWLWRDRKGLVGNLLGPFANAVFLYGAASYFWKLEAGGGWPFHDSIRPWLLHVYQVTLGISLVQAAIRMRCSARIYGWRFASAGPLRMICGNLVNSAATVAALWQFFGARLAKRAPAWLKTDHVYPRAITTAQGRPRLGEVLIKMRCVSMSDLEDALVSRPSDLRIGEHLVRSRKLTEEHLYQALSSQAGIPLGIPQDGELRRAATRVLPAETARRWKVMPYRVAVGQLHVLTADVPTEEMTRALEGLSDLQICFRLVRPAEFEALTRKYMPRLLHPVAS
jgi:adsorption protein B